MKVDKIKTLLEKYYQGKTSLEEEKLLRESLQSALDLPENLKADAELFTMMGALENDQTEQAIDLESSETTVIPMTPDTPKQNGSWIAKIAAGFAILIIGAMAGWMFGNQGNENQDVAELRKDIDEMKQIVTLSQLRKESASERILATYEFKKLDSANDEILDALIYTFNNDDNANVKNAAAEALFKFGNHNKVRKAFINGLATQTDPVLQIKLIDMLVGLKEKRALPKLQQMMEEESQMKIVKQKAAQGIGQLL